MATTTQGPPATAAPVLMRPPRRDVGEILTAYAFLLPFGLFFLIFMAYPFVQGLWISLHEWAIIGQERPFVGLQNYEEMVRDSAFWSSLWNTVYFVLLSVPPLVTLGLLLAMALNRRLRLRGLFRATFFAPYMVSISVVGMVWLIVLNPRFGPFNYYLGLLGIQPHNWLGEVEFAMPAVALTTVWWTVGFNMVMFLAGLQDIPEELYEAAKIDGAGAWARFRFLTLPLLRRVTLFVTVIQVIASFQIFGQVYIMTQGGPYGATRVLVQYIYENGFKYFRMGYASAMSFGLLAVVLVFTLVQFRLGRSEED